MPLQIPQFLSAVGLGIENDTPVDALQPPLPDGVHLRWQFGPFRAFPWHGYYLFRRPHQEDDRVCAQGRFRSLATNFLGAPFNGALGTPEHVVPEGTFQSDRPLIVTDDFPAPNFAELDLRDRDRLSYRFAEPARRVISEIGFRGDGSDVTCIRFSQADPTTASAPRVVQGASITTRDFAGASLPSSDLRPLGPAFVLDLNAGARIELPCLATQVLIALVSGNRSGSVEARDPSGAVVDQSDIPEPRNGIILIQLSGANISVVDLDLPQNETSLLAMCWRCPDAAQDANPDSVELRYLAGATVIHTQTVTGAAGAVVSTAFDSDLITSVEYSGADAALVDVCYVPVRAALLSNSWAPVPDLSQPIALPVRDPQYPASGAQPANQAASEAEALSRIRYGAPADWQGGRFDALHDAMRRLVDQGPGGPPMAQIGDSDVPGIPDQSGPQEDPTLSRMRPLNYLLVGALYPQVSQMLGLYWADQTAAPGQRYDYMIVADHGNVATGGSSAMLGYLGNPAADLFRVDIWISYDLGRGTPAPLAQPVDLRAYALPGSTRESAGGDLMESDNNAGLRWSIPELAPGELTPDAPVLHWVRRADLGLTTPSGPAPVGAHQQVTDLPHAVTQPNLPAGVSTPQRSADWPPHSMHYIDGGLAEGWYSYRVNAIDLFGRWSLASDPAEWWQWDPAPDPVPWYFDPAQGAARVHPNAVSLLDKTAPPRPPAVEAFALDAADRHLDRDARFQAWFSTLTPAEQTDVVGLRVRWLWSYAQMRQAPDTAEFRVYLSPGLANSTKGRITGVAAAGASRSQVTTTIANSQPADAWSGAILRTGSRSYTVTGSQGGTPLVLELDNLGPAGTQTPQDGLRCTLTLPGGTNSTHPLATDLADPTQWDDRIWVVGIDDHVAEGVVPGRTQSGATLAGSGATVAGAVVTVPGGTDLEDVQPLNTHAFLATDTARASRLYRIMAVDPAVSQLTLDAPPALAGATSDWEIGAMVRRYEVFLPAPGDADRGGVSLPTSRSEPMAYAQIGVTAVDDKPHTADAARWAGARWGDRPGNEGAVGGPATIYRAHQVPPPAPRVPPDADAVFASPPDYDKRSFYTLRWVPEPDVFTHVFRALDVTVFDRDWAIRETREALNAATHADLFPQGWTAPRRTAAAAALNAITGPGDYAGLSADALDLLGRLPGNEGFASAGGLADRDWIIRRTRRSLSQADGALFPEDWTDALVREAAADMLNAIADRTDYDQLSNTALRVLGALPGLKGAYQQITDVPLSNTGAATANRAGPDNPPGFTVDPALRAYVDALDGRARNRYFYRTAFVDEAQNLGPLGLSSPPVNLRDVVAPRRPVFLRALAGNPAAGADQSRAITLAWASNREVDLVAYRLYRTDTAENARSTRLMDMVHELAVPAGDPALRPAENVFVDVDRPGLVTFTYVLEAIDASGNRSRSSDPIAARAFDTSLPDVPPATLAWVDLAGDTRAEIAWTSPHDIMVQRQTGDGMWVDIGTWQPAGPNTLRDDGSDPGRATEYRLIARKYTGARMLGGAQTLAPAGP